MASASEDVVRLQGRFAFRQKDEIAAEIWYKPSAEELESMSSYLVDEEEPAKQFRYAVLIRKPTHLPFGQSLRSSIIQTFSDPNTKRLG